MWARATPPQQEIKGLSPWSNPPPSLNSSKMFNLQVFLIGVILLQEDSSPKLNPFIKMTQLPFSSLEYLELSFPTLLPDLLLSASLRMPIMIKTKPVKKFMGIFSTKTSTMIMTKMKIMTKTMSYLVPTSTSSPFRLPAGAARGHGASN